MSEVTNDGRQDLIRISVDRKFCLKSF